MCPFAHGQQDLRSIVVEPTQPDYGNAGEFLFSILRSFEQVFSEDEEKKISVERAIELVKENKLP